MRLPEYDELDATALAAMVRRGEVSPEELLEAAIERIEARDGALNAVVLRLYERARERVGRLPDGPARGVPFLVKDLRLRLAGTPTSNGCKLAARQIAPRSSLLGERYEQAGLQILGKTNTPEFGIMGITEPELWGPCRNPWATDRTPGGSSGGAAAAVAARIVPAAHGGDAGGSSRIPAAACGLFGLKPSRGRVSMAPFAGEALGGFVQEHALTRSVRDSALLLDIADPPTPGEPYASPPKERPWVDEVGRKPGRLRIAFTREPLYATATHPDCQAAVDDAAALLASLGHDVVEARPSFPREEMVRAYFLTFAAGVGFAVEEAAREAGRAPRPADFEPGSWLFRLIGQKSSATELVAAEITMQRAAREVARFFETHDLLLTSTLARPPARIGELAIGPNERRQMALLRTLPLRALLDRALHKLGGGKLAWTPNTQLYNQTGQPAMSVPLYWNAEGLPIGVQLAARFGAEATLFRLAAELEQARPWAARLPPLVRP